MFYNQNNGNCKLHTGPDGAVAKLVQYNVKKSKCTNSTTCVIHTINTSRHTRVEAKLG